MPLPRLRSGDMRHKIAIRRAQQTDDGKGGFVTSWATIAEPWAEVNGLDGREAVIAQALQGVSTYRFRIYYLTGVQASDQVRYDGADLNIRSAYDPNGDREQLVILADTASAQAG